MPSLRAPRYDAPVDLAAHLAMLPPGATNRGMFFQDIFTQVQKVAPGADLAALAGVTPRRYVPFLEYPYTDFLKLLYTGARLMRPQGPIGEGLRRFGQTTYDALLGSHAGRVVFGALGIDFRQICKYAPKGYRLALNFASVVSVEAGPNRYLVHYEGLPCFLETFQPGVVEGAARHCQVDCSVQVELRDLAHATLEVTWR